MKILSLDISTQCGYALFDGVTRIKSGTVFLAMDTTYDIKSKPYPLSYVLRADAISDLLMRLVDEFKPDILVIEETNKAKARYSQKLLEFIHLSFLKKVYDNIIGMKIEYLNTSSWRKTLKVAPTKEDKLNNLKVREAKKKKKSKKELGLKGKITTKHLAIRFVNQTLNLDLKVKDNNEADAIALNLAYQMGASVVSGV